VPDTQNQQDKKKAGSGGLKEVKPLHS
jgi:hypothetical protein